MIFLNLYLINAQVLSIVFQLSNLFHLSSLHIYSEKVHTLSTWKTKKKYLSSLALINSDNETRRQVLRSVLRLSLMRC